MLLHRYNIFADRPTISPYFNFTPTPPPQRPHHPNRSRILLSWSAIAVRNQRRPIPRIPHLSPPTSPPADATPVQSTLHTLSLSAARSRPPCRKNRCWWWWLGRSLTVRREWRRFWRRRCDGVQAAWGTTTWPREGRRRPVSSFGTSWAPAAAADRAR